MFPVAGPGGLPTHIPEGVTSRPEERHFLTGEAPEDLMGGVQKVQAQWTSGPILAPHLPRGYGQGQRGVEPARGTYKV